MRTALARLSETLRDLPLRRNAAGIVVTLFVNGLVLMMLLTLAPAGTFRQPDDSTVNVFNVPPPPPPPQPKPEHQKIVVKRVFRVGHAPAPVPPPPSPATSWANLGIIEMSHDELAQVDNSMKAPPVPRPVRDSTPTVRTANSDTPVAPGKGPHGETLYAGVWVRMPTYAETDPYTPPSARVGDFAIIACRTAPRNHLEDCVEIMESPTGSGIARGMINAAWQFQMRPPRLGGQYIIGAWVRLRVTVVPRDKDEARLR